MSKSPLRLLGVLLLSVAAEGLGQSPPITDWHGFMPRADDRTSLWWRDGFPSIVDGAPWHRCVKTGSYQFVQDTRTLQFPHLGPSSSGPLSSLPKARLDLIMRVNGRTYFCQGAEEWSRFAGPRLIESGRFLQRADVTHLIFSAKDGTSLNAEARLESIAWPDQLGLILAARPGLQPIATGENSFGRVRGGFGLDGSNRFDVPAENCTTAESFTLAFWVFPPADFRAGKNAPWLLCKNAHEQADGNYGITVDQDGIPEARLNLGGGRENAHAVKADRRHRLQLKQWNHLAIGYDGKNLRLYVNGHFAIEHAIGKPRVPQPGGLTIGDRQDGLGDGDFRFRGVIDEVRLFARALSLEELRRLRNAPENVPPDLQGIRSWTFRKSGTALMTRPREPWEEASLEVRLSKEERLLESQWTLPEKEAWASSEWQQVSLMMNPATFEPVEPSRALVVHATETETSEARPVEFDSALGWYRINLDGVEPIAPRGQTNPTNDALERIRIELANPTDREEIARLMFEKTAGGFRQRIGTPITGISAILRDLKGNPTGIPVQLSKNWHSHPEGGVYNGQWFHGISQVRLPAGARVELELTLAYGHWGGVAAASHSQLSLIGWGGNQRWDQAALGSWGESLCFSPEQNQANCTITDVRPLMVTPTREEQRWNWTNNHGGGDFFRFFDAEGQRCPHTRMRTVYHRQGPCFTEVSYSGQIHRTGIRHQSTVSLARSDDIAAGTYRIRLEVTEPVEFSRFVLFQIGADTYSSTAERKMAIGDEAGLLREWNTQWGGDTYRVSPIEGTGSLLWASLHETIGSTTGAESPGAWANRGIVIRDWNARLGGREARPWLAERGIDLKGGRVSSTLDLLPPPGVTRLEPGDYIEATIEHLVMPRFAEDYYGPNERLRSALKKQGNSWQMIYRQAVANHREVGVRTGKNEQTHPDIRMVAEKDVVEFTLVGGLGYVPLTISGLSSHRGYELTIDGVPLKQAVHGNDFWQADFDPQTRTWSHTYNLPSAPHRTRTVQFAPRQP